MVADSDVDVDVDVDANVDADDGAIAPPRTCTLEVKRYGNDESVWNANGVE